MTARLTLLSLALCNCGDVGCPVSPNCPGQVAEIPPTHLALADFTNPAAPEVEPVDMGFVVAPYNWASADQSFNLTWHVQEPDATGRFYFYFLDHEPTFQVQPSDVEALAQPVLERGNPLAPVAVWASCACGADAGAACPDGGEMRSLSPGSGDCRNQIEWDTSQIPSGSYWPIAIIDDAPVRLYRVAGGPVRIAHGAQPLPPAVIVLRPDGFNSYDAQYRAQWIATGTPPLTFDLTYGLDESTNVLAPTTSLATGLSMESYDWNVSVLKSWTIYFLRVTVTDGARVKSYSDSRFGLSIYHRTAGP